MKTCLGEACGAYLDEDQIIRERAVNRDLSRFCHDRCWIYVECEMAEGLFGSRRVAEIVQD